MVMPPLILASTSVYRRELLSRLKLPFDVAALTPQHWVADIVYFPAETELLRRARSLGCRTLAGTGMAIFQAIKAFELFTGLSADRESMTRHFEAAA